jgi:multiple sugar transport system substrate-binding protein
VTANRSPTRPVNPAAAQYLLACPNGRGVVAGLDLAIVNSENSVKGLEFYKALYDCCTPPGASNSYMGEGVDAFKSGQVAMHMNFAFTWPGLYKDPNVGGDKIGFFANPAEKKHFAQLGGQGISVVSYSDHQDDAFKYIKWFVKPEVQAKWWALGGYSCAKSVLNAPGFVASAPYAVVGASSRICVSFVPA